MLKLQTNRVWLVVILLSMGLGGAGLVAQTLSSLSIHGRVVDWPACLWREPRFI